ncbi:MAG: sigma 54-interacting transcriptional regulator [Oligoflexia bacterium]|nr:sigma 54-interacting transcriptional regulator [Oligoflexia bacterium]
MSLTMSLDQSQQVLKDGYLVPLAGGSPTPVEGVVTIGRDPTTLICISDPTLSLFHCQIEKRPFGFFIRDLKSRNGTFLNGSRVTEAQLLEDARIQVGNSEFSFRSLKPPEEVQDLPVQSKNPVLLSQLRSIQFVANSDMPVLIQGESGSGKEVMARLIHDQSLRSKGPYITVNCSALTESLVESELFGHMRGSFTGATSDRKGAFEAAKGGTLFLDEIGDLPINLQPKLLRALENKEIRPVGSDRIVRTDVRIITATHKNLESLVAEGLFRADLFYRIHVIRLRIPSLRERMEDFEDLLYQFCREMRVRFSVSAIENLKKHTWPGNIRELKNVVARAKALFGNRSIQLEHLNDIVDRPILNTPPAQGPVFSSGSPVLKELERELIKARLRANGGNQRRTAFDLGIPKSTLHDRIKAYQIDVKGLLGLDVK